MRILQLRGCIASLTLAPQPVSVSAENAQVAADPSVAHLGYGGPVCGFEPNPAALFSAYSQHAPGLEAGLEAGLGPTQVATRLIMCALVASLGDGDTSDLPRGPVSHPDKVLRQAVLLSRSLGDE